jgi:hypothetical protein
LFLAPAAPSPLRQRRRLIDSLAASRLIDDAGSRPKLGPWKIIRRNPKNGRAEISEGPLIGPVKLMTGRRPWVPQSAPSSVSLVDAASDKWLLGVVHHHGPIRPEGPAETETQAASQLFTTANRCLRQLKQVKDESEHRGQKWRYFFKAANFFFQFLGLKGEFVIFFAQKLQLLLSFTVTLPQHGSRLPFAFPLHFHLAFLSCRSERDEKNK